MKLYRWKDIKDGGLILDTKSEEYFETATRMDCWRERGFCPLAWSETDIECWSGAIYIEQLNRPPRMDTDDLVYLTIQIALEKAGL